MKKIIKQIAVTVTFSPPPRPNILVGRPHMGKNIPFARFLIVFRVFNASIPATDRTINYTTMSTISSQVNTANGKDTSSPTVEVNINVTANSDIEFSSIEPTINSTEGKIMSTSTNLCKNATGYNETLCFNSTTAPTTEKITNTDTTTTIPVTGPTNLITYEHLALYALHEAKILTLSLSMDGDKVRVMLLIRNPKKVLLSWCKYTLVLTVSLSLKVICVALSGCVLLFCPLPLFWYLWSPIDLCRLWPLLQRN